VEKKLKKFGSKEKSRKEGEFFRPYGITVNEKYLYVCDTLNFRIQILDKENGTYISKLGQKIIIRPQSILLYENLIYIGHDNGIDVFTKETQLIQTFGKRGGNQGEFRLVTGLCIFDEILYCVDWGNGRVQVWN